MYARNRLPNVKGQFNYLRTVSVAETKLGMFFNSVHASLFGRTVAMTEKSFAVSLPITEIWQSIELTSSMPSIYLSLGLSLALMYTGRQPFHFLNAPTNTSQSPGFDTSDLPDPNVLDGPLMAQGQSPADFDNQPASSNDTASVRGTHTSCQQPRHF
jgi:hypothetical protein